MNLPRHSSFRNTWQKILLSVGLLVTLLVLAWPRAGLAQTPPLNAIPTQLTLTGALDNGPFVTSLRLNASVVVTNVQIFASDLQPITVDGRTRDPIPGRSVTLLPAAQFTTLLTDSVTALAVQVEPPTQAGSYSGTLTIRWQTPTPGELNLPLRVEARTQPALVIQSPAQVAINAAPDERITRQIVLRETVGGSPLTGLQALPQDLLTADGRRTIPVTQLELVTPAVISGGQVATATLTVSLPGANAGAYSGSVLFTWPDGGVITLPVTANVKTWAAWPLFLLVIGVVLGTALTYYQEKGQVQDGIMLRLAILRQAMAEDPDITKYFGSRLTPTLNLVDQEIRATRWTKSEQALTQAEALVNKWRGAPTTWLDLFKVLQQDIIDRLDKNDETVIGRTLKAQAQTLTETAADLVDPAQFRDKIVALKAELLPFWALKAQINTVADLQMDPAIPTGFKDTVLKSAQIEFERRLSRLPLGDANARDQLEKDIVAFLKAIPAQLEASREQQAVMAVSKENGARGVMSEIQAILPFDFIIPDPASLAVATPTMLARIRHTLLVRRWLFTAGAYILSIILVIGTGYINLYDNNPTFGATGGDYLNLFAWGLTGQTTLTTVANQLINWGVKRPAEKS